VSYGAGDGNRIVSQISKPHRNKVLPAALQVNCCQVLPGQVRHTGCVLGIAHVYAAPSIVTRALIRSFFGRKGDLNAREELPTHSKIKTRKRGAPSLVRVAKISLKIAYHCIHAGRGSSVRHPPVTHVLGADSTFDLRHSILGLRAQRMTLIILIIPSFYHAP